MKGNIKAIAASLLLLLAACDPKDACDPGYKASFATCVPLPKPDAGHSAGDAATADDAGHADVGTCAPYAHFGATCQRDTDCGCGAATCATQGLFYCTHLNCASDPKSCPPSWTCTDISAVSPDPNVKSICLHP